MKKSIFTITILLFTYSIFSQNVVSGTVVDSETNETIPYVNIGILKQTLGTVSNESGKFEFEVKDDFMKDTIRVSSIGYKTISLVASDFIKKMKVNAVLPLTADVTELNEVTITARELKEKVLGNKARSKSLKLSFSVNELGNELGTKINIKHNPTFLKSFNTHIVTNTNTSLKYRLNIYSIKNGLPDKKIVNENIIFPIDVEKGDFSLNLEKYRIYVEDDIYCTIELIETPNEDDDIGFSGSLFGHAMIVRTTSQAEWEKVGTIGVGFNCTVKY
ncbi:carboxypeptidase-like regulatory domain-containing protein [Maribacter forsetii]|uniref:carboxypeptidase-like regulatory domain-containing protein n=1 Tax=Maribacter forsetii TaxID=444515 RepID=UPI00055C71E0|nr:carboxypeptidase-like regulatory domain-containing protein [Maribacter forsetii]